MLKKLTFKNELNVPFLPGKAVVNGDYNDKLVSYDLSASYGSQKLANSLSLKRNERVQGDHNLKFELSVNQHKLDLESKREIDASTQKASWDGKLTTSFGTDIRVKGTNGPKISVDEADVTCHANIVISEDLGPFE